MTESITQTVRHALAEDVGSGDISAALIPASARSEAVVICREAAVLCGTAWFDEVFRQLDNTISVTWHVHDGDAMPANQRLCSVNGPSRSLLTGERTALNFLQTLSGTATLARRYADAVRGTDVRILDTRKTLPGLRAAQKYAVVCGGCYNHRQGLYDAILIKENHILAAGSIIAAVRSAKTSAPHDLLIEVEVETLDQVIEVLAAGAKRLLLDNFTLENLTRAVQLVKGRAELEASGGITLSNVRAIAETSVDYISVGELTKHVRAIDLSMRFSPFAARPQ